MKHYISFLILSLFTIQTAFAQWEPLCAGMAAPTVTNFEICDANSAQPFRVTNQDIYDRPGNPVTSVYYRWYKTSAESTDIIANVEAHVLTSPQWVSSYQGQPFVTYYVEAYVATYNCRSPKAEVRYKFVESGPTPTMRFSTYINNTNTVFSNLNVCSDERLDISVGGGSFSNIQWRDPSGAVISSGKNLIPKNGTYRVYANYASGCTTGSTSGSFSLNVSTLTPPSIVGATTVYKGETNTYSVNSPGATNATYEWLLNGAPVATTASYTLPQFIDAGTYSLSCRMSATYAGMCADRRTFNLPAVNFTVISDIDKQNANFIKEDVVVKKGVKEESVINNLPIGDRIQQINYYDGLGRPMQKVVTQGSVAKKDVVQPIRYDAFGRQYRTYLPVVTSDNDGWYRNDILDQNGNFASEVTNFYNNPSDDIADDARPYAEVVFEASPLNRPQKEFGAGQAWYANNKFVGHQYLSNMHGVGEGQEKIVAWTIDQNTGLPLRTELKANVIETGGYYAANQLFINVVKDEEGNEVREYTEKGGKIILKKVQVQRGTADLNSGDQWALTYYVYDFFGMLRYVFQPELSRKIHQSDTYVPTTTDLANFAFQYKYDGRKRMTHKKVPGADWVYMVYDARDRLVLTQDGNLRNGYTDIRYWAFIKYDELNRPVMTGVKDTAKDVTITQEQMQAEVDKFYTKTWTRLSETFIGNSAGNIHGYSNKSYPVITGPQGTVNRGRYFTITYYDNYDFKSLLVHREDYDYVNDNLTTTVNGNVYSQPTTFFPTVKGQITGTKIRMLDGNAYTWLSTVNYYDDKYRVIQLVGDNYKSGIDRTSHLIDFTGKILKTKISHNIQNVTWRDKTGAVVVGNRLVRRATGSDWGGAGARSVQVLKANTDGWIEFPVEYMEYRVVGLSASNQDAGYTSIDYAFYIHKLGALRVFEKGAQKYTVPGGYKEGDVLRIERVGTSIYYKRINTNEILYVSKVSSSSSLFADASLYTYTVGVEGVKSSFSKSHHTLEKRFVYDHAGRLENLFQSFDNGVEVEVARHEYNELGQLIEKKLHSVNGEPFKQSIDYRYNIRGWLTRINDAQLSEAEAAKDFWGMNLGYNEDADAGDSELDYLSRGVVGSYPLNQNANDETPNALHGTVMGAQPVADAQGNAGQAYDFTTGYVEVPNSADKHAFIQNTGVFTLSAFIKISDLNARSVIISNTGSSAHKGFSLMYETYGNGLGDHQLRFTITRGVSNSLFMALGAQNTINDNQWHHVAVVGNGSNVRFYVDGRPDGQATTITLLSEGSSSYASLIGKSRLANGSVTLGMSGAVDDLVIWDRALTQDELDKLSRRQPITAPTGAGQYNGNISHIQWTVNQGLGDVKQMGYNFSYDAMNRLTSAIHTQTASSGISQSGKFHEKDLGYDLNGNIKRLMRYNENGVMDALTYTYGAGNQLAKVVDAGDKYQGFIEGTNAATVNDYTYDYNGNLWTDLNKGISSNITYNLLNLPEVVVNGGNSIRYIYDATGNKCGQVTTFVGAQKQTEYVGPFVYENDELQFVNHEEGRIVIAQQRAIYTNDGTYIGDVTPSETTVETITLNGDQTYIKVVAQGANPGTGIYPIGSAFPVQPGERYRIRLKGYRNNATYAPSIFAATNMGTLDWPGATLPTGVSSEAWIEQTVVIPEGATQLEVGVVWNTVVATAQFFLNDFEIIKLENNDLPEYQYHLKDHLGNVRLTFTTKPETETNVATLESSNSSSESAKFIRYSEAVKINAQLFDHTHETTSAQAQGDTFNSTRLAGSQTERIGLARSFNVMPGDTIKMEVYAKYLDPNKDNWNAALTNMMAQMAPVSGPQTSAVDGGSTGSGSENTFPFGDVMAKSTTDDGAPRAYLNYLVFDKNYNPILSQSGYKKISEAAKENGSDAAHEKLSHELTITEPGFVYIYLSNEEETPVEVFFDDFTVTQVAGPVVQMDDYYPFGLTFGNYRREHSVGNNYLFNGNEIENGLSLDVYMTDFRFFDPTIGRLWQIDPIDKENLSPYIWAVNNPVLYMDMLGLDTLKSTDPKLDWNSVKPGDILDGATVMQEAKVTSQPLSKAEQKWLTYVEGYGYYYPGEKVISKRNGVPGLEDFFGHRQIGNLSFDTEGRLLGVILTGTAPSVGSVNVVSSVKKYSDLLRIARQVGTSPQIRNEINKLIRELVRGNFGAGRGAKSLGFGGIHEMRGVNGARVYFRNTPTGGYEVVAYSDKATQESVIKSLRNLYGN